MTAVWIALTLETVALALIAIVYWPFPRRPRTGMLTDMRHITNNKKDDRASVRLPAVIRSVRPAKPDLAMSPTDWQQYASKEEE